MERKERRKRRRKRRMKKRRNSSEVRGGKRKESLISLLPYPLTISGGHQRIPRKFLWISNGPDFFQTLPHGDEDASGSLAMIVAARA